MSYDDFITELGKAGLTVREFANLVGMRANSVSNNAKRGEVPAHLAIIASLLAELHSNGIPFKPIFAHLNLSKKKPRGNASSGKFGGDKQEQLEFDT